MIDKESLCDELSLEFRRIVDEHGWKECAESTAGCLEFVADLCDARLLPPIEMRRFGQQTQRIIRVLLEGAGHSNEPEFHRLIEAAMTFNEAQQPASDERAAQTNSELWTLDQALEWRGAVDQARRICQACCYSWRTMHIGMVSTAFREDALRCIEQLERRLPVFSSGRFVDKEKQLEAYGKCVVLAAQLAAYAEEMSSIAEFTEAITGSTKLWAAFLEAVSKSKWLDSNDPLHYITSVTSRIYRSEVSPDICGRDSQGFEHRAGPGGKIRDNDALRDFSTSHFTLDDVVESTPDGLSLERRFTKRSVSELLRAAEGDPRLSQYVRAICRYPRWPRCDVWKSLGWDDKVGRAVDRQFRRLRQHLKQIGAGMDWREVPTGISNASQTTYFETLLDGKRGTEFGVIQHRLLKTGKK